MNPSKEPPRWRSTGIKLTQLPQYQISTTVAVALGSNLGDSRSHLDHAVARLREFLDSVRVSSYYQTAPVDVVGDQPDFLNAAAVGETTMTALELLTVLLAIERER